MAQVVAALVLVGMIGYLVVRVVRGIADAVADVRIERLRLEAAQKTVQTVHSEEEHDMTEPLDRMTWHPTDKVIQVNFVSACGVRVVSPHRVCDLTREWWSFGFRALMNDLVRAAEQHAALDDKSARMLRDIKHAIQ